LWGIILKRYCLVGVKGIGKTTLIDAIRVSVPNVEFIIGSIVLKELVGENFSNFDYFSDEEKEFYRKKAIQFFDNKQKISKKKILIDGHVTLYNPKKDLIELVFTKEDSEFYTDLVLYDTNVEIIYNRRKNDHLKKRIIDKEIIEKEILTERKEAEIMAQKFGMKFHIIDGRNFDKAKSQFITILNEE